MPNKKKRETYSKPLVREPIYCQERLKKKKSALILNQKHVVPLSGFLLVQDLSLSLSRVAFDWPLSRGSWPRPESAAAAVSLHVNALARITMATDDKQLVGKHCTKFLVRIGVVSFGNLHVNSF